VEHTSVPSSHTAHATLQVVQTPASTYWLVWHTVAVAVPVLLDPVPTGKSLETVQDTVSVPGTVDDKNVKVFVLVAESTTLRDPSEWPPESNTVHTKSRLKPPAAVTVTVFVAGVSLRVASVLAMVTTTFDTAAHSAPFCTHTTHT
jgi:hypothetical protein